MGAWVWENERVSARLATWHIIVLTTRRHAPLLANAPSYSSGTAVAANIQFVSLHVINDYDDDGPSRNAVQLEVRSLPFRAHTFTCSGITGRIRSGHLWIVSKAGSVRASVRADSFSSCYHAPSMLISTDMIDASVRCWQGVLHCKW